MESYISKFGVGNFKVFRELNEFQLAPITILTGTNNSGKSSLIKALLLLKNSYLKNGMNELEFMDSEHKLGSFKEVLNNKKTSNKSITYKFEIQTHVTKHRGTYFYLIYLMAR